MLIYANLQLNVGVLIVYCKTKEYFLLHLCNKKEQPRSETVHV